MGLLGELKRRNVIRAALAYLVAAWLLLQVADLGMDVLGLPDWTGRLVLLVLVLGFPLVLVFSWIYELTPGGLQRESDLPPPESRGAVTRHRLDRVIIGLLVLAVAVLAADRWLFRDATMPPPAGGTASQPDAAPADRSVAVMPFVNLSDDRKNEYFSHGVAEEVLNLVARIEGLRVAARSSSFALAARGLPAGDIGRELNVATVLEGSVRRAGERVRVSVQLVNVADSFQLWSEIYDRRMEDIFDVQDDIAKHIAGALQVRLAGEGPRSSEALTADLRAYELYLEGRALWRSRAPEALQRSTVVLQEAVTRDPRFARAWSGLAAAWTVLPYYDPRTDWQAAVVRAGDAAAGALALDERLAEPWAVRGALAAFDQRWAEAEEALLKAIALEPSDPVPHHWYSNMVLIQCGRLEEALDHARQARALDPANAGAAWSLAEALVAAGRPAEALEVTADARSGGLVVRLNSAEVLARLATGPAEAAADAVADYARANGAAVWDGFGTAYVAARNGNAASRAAVEAEIDRLAGESGVHALVALRNLAIALGMDHWLVWRTEDNPAWLRPSDRMAAFWMPAAAPLRREERFVELLEAAGLTDYWDQVGWPKALCRKSPEGPVCQ